MFTLLPTLIAQFGDGLTPPTSSYAQNTEKDTILTSFDSIISNLIGLFTIVGSLIFVIYFIIASVEWITAGGDSGKIEKARTKMLHGVLGLIILVASYAILGLIGTIVGIEILDPVSQINNILPTQP